MKKKKSFKKFLLKLSIFNIVVLGIVMGFFSYEYNKYDLNVEALTSVNNGIRVSSGEYSSNDLYNTNRSIIELNALPNYVKNAFIDTEDKRFYSHHGYDAKRIVKALIVNTLNNEKSQGASTISQQLIKNTLLSNEKTYSRKFKELILSIKMEKNFSKNEILEMYLNTIYFGSNAYGINNASRFYFNKSAKDLTPSEACTLAGIIKSPKFYNPITNLENATKRRNLVAKNMLKAGHIDNETYNEIINTEIEIKQNLSNNAYNEEAIFEACNLLNITERELINNGYQIITFQDEKLQLEAQNIITKNIESNESDSSTLDGLSVTVNSKGHVLAYAKKSNYSLHNLKRQPASTLKPLAVYLPCFQYNILSPSSQILDEKINYNGYSPENADKAFHGYVTVREAIAKSMNIPAVKALDYVGLKKSKSSLESLGINIEQKDLNLTLALGATSNGVNIIDLLNAYLTISTSGERYCISFVNKILDKNGIVIYSNDNYNEKVLDESDCYLVTSCLKDTAKTGTARRLNDLELPVASKTGTANNGKGNTDLYNIAYTTEHCIITWIGDIPNKILPSNLKSSGLPTDINKEILKLLYKNHTPDDFPTPSGIVKSKYSQDELSKNHRLVYDSNSSSWDYFKVDDAPIVLNENQNEISVKLSNAGALISYNIQPDISLSLIKFAEEKETIVLEDLNSYGEYLDTNIFKYNEVEYYLKLNDTIKSEKIKVYPKDELLKDLNKKVTSKRKWQI